MIALALHEGTEESQADSAALNRCIRFRIIASITKLERGRRCAPREGSTKIVESSAGAYFENHVPKPLYNSIRYRVRVFCVTAPDVRMFEALL